MRVSKFAVVFPVVAALVILSIGELHAATIADPSWTRPTTLSQASTDGTTFDVWNESFTTATGQNLPGNGFGATPQYTPASVNPNSTNGTVTNDYLQDVTAATDGAFLIGNAATGTAHIYSFSAATTNTAFVPQYGKGAGWETDVFAQVTVAGTLLDLDNVTLNYPGLSTPLRYSSYTETDTPISGGFGGTLASYTFSFVIPNFNPSSLSVAFPGAGSSVSFYSASVDTAVRAVPEPASLVILGMGGLGLALLRFRRARADQRHAK